MTVRQMRFCEEYLVSGNATDAAIRAGYSPKTARQAGSENLSKPDIKKHIEEELARIQSEKLADAEEVLEYLTAVMRGETTSSVLSLCGDGCQEIIQKAPDEKERLKAAELLGRRYGLFKDNLDVNGTVPVVITGGDDLED